MKKNTKIGLGIGAAILAALALFSGKSSAATNPPQTPPPGPTPTPPPSSEPPQTPPQQPPPAPAPPASKVPTAGPQPIDFATVPAPAGTGVRAVVWQWSSYAATGQEWKQLSSTDMDGLSVASLDLKALFAQLTAYKPFPPPYQAVHLYPYSFGSWLPSWQSFNNYDAVKGGTEWSWVRVWRWDGSTWVMQSETGAQSSAVPAATLANGIKDVPPPPYLISQAFRWSTTQQAWQFAASAKNY